MNKPLCYSNIGAFFSSDYQTFLSQIKNNEATVQNLLKPLQK